MTVRECYDAMGADYEDVMRRLRTDDRVKKFLLRLLDDKSFEMLKNAMAQKNMEEVFRAAHTMKGVGQNLSLTRLYESAATLSDEVRDNKTYREELEALFAQIKEGEIKELNIVLKADVQGSIEAIRQSLEKLGNDEVRVNIIRTAVGGIREADVMLAAASNALIIGFNVRPDANARKLAEKEEIQINTYRVIYEAIEDVKAALSGMLDPDIKEVELGQAEIRSIFKVPKVGAVAGCYITEGKFTRSARVRVVRDGVVIHEGNLASLKRFKDDVKEVASGFECGLSIERFNDIKEGDILEAYTFEEVKRAL